MSSLLLELPGPRHVQGGLWYSTPASTRFGRHHHQELELNVIVTGVARYAFSHRELSVVAPAALWIPPLVEHELLDASADLSMWVHSFRVPARDRGASGAASDAEPVRPADAARGGAARVAEAARVEAARLAVLAEIGDAPRVTGISPGGLARICALSRHGLLRPRLAQFNALLAQILAAAWSERRPPGGRDAPCHPTARRAARLLREPDSARSMEELARSSPLSRERLSRVFAQCFGIGLVQYRNHHRVQRFIRTYGHGSDDNMLRAALDVGFGSYVQFHRAFKQVVGCCPTQHLERVRDGIVDPARTGGSGGRLA